jgi:hypothetical protein
MITMDKNKQIKRPEGKRGTGRPKLRWEIVWTMTSGF